MQEVPASEPQPPKPGRMPAAAIVTGIALVALVGLAVGVALLAPRGPASYEPGSPEAAFQAFYQAYEARDIEASYALFSPAVRATLPLDEYRRLEADFGWQHEEDLRVVLLGADVIGDRATLRLRIDRFSGGGFGGERYSESRSVRLVRADGDWLIDERLVGVEPVPFGY